MTIIFRCEYWNLFLMLFVIHIQAKNALGVNQATKNMDEVLSEGKTEIVKRQATLGKLKNFL